MKTRDRTRCGLALLTLLLALPAHAKTKTFVVTQAKIFRTKGTVEVGSPNHPARTVVEPPPRYQNLNLDANGGEKPPADPSILNPGDSVTTGKDAECDIYIPGGGSMRVAAESKILIPALPKEGEKPASATVELAKGTAFFTVKIEKPMGGVITIENPDRNTKPIFRVKAPKSIIGVGGTSFFVAAREKHDAAGVREGTITVTEPESGATARLGAGFRTTSRAGELTPPRKLSKAQRAALENAMGFEVKIVRVRYVLEESSAVTNVGSGENPKPTDTSKPRLEELLGDQGFLLGVRCIFEDDDHHDDDRLHVRLRLEDHRLPPVAPIAAKIAFNPKGVRSLHYHVLAQAGGEWVSTSELADAKFWDWEAFKPNSWNEVLLPWPRRDLSAPLLLPHLDVAAYAKPKSRAQLDILDVRLVYPASVELPPTKSTPDARPRG